MTFPCITIAALAATLAAPPQGDLDPEALGAFLDPIFAETMAAEHVPGAAIAIVHDGRIVFARGYGVAQIDGKPVDPENTLFRIGSVSKAVTALGIVRQIDLSGDLDAVYAKMMSMKTQGGDEYVGWVLHDALSTMSWSADPDALDTSCTVSMTRPPFALPSR